MYSIELARRNLKDCCSAAFGVLVFDSTPLEPVVARLFTADVVVSDMGERVCYLEFCPVCDGPVSHVDEVCPDCGADLGS